MRAKYKINEVCSEIGVEEDFVWECVHRQWLQPLEPEPLMLDREDLARLRLIWELHKEMKVNDEGVDIILHLIDQIHLLQSRLRVYAREGRPS